MNHRDRRVSAPFRFAGNKNLGRAFFDGTAPTWRKAMQTARPAFSTLIRQSVNVKYIQQQLGHGSITITLDIYSHLFHEDHPHHVHHLDDRLKKMDTIGAVESKFATQSQPRDGRLSDWHAEQIDGSGQKQIGGVTEWPNVPVLKTGDLARGPRVQISPPPPIFPTYFALFQRELWLSCGLSPLESCAFAISPFSESSRTASMPSLSLRSASEKIA